MLCLLVAITGTLAAVCFDLRQKRIPNGLLGLMLLSSAPIALLQGNMIPWALNVALAFILFYTFWTLRVWAGGDSKLFIALAALIPRYPETAFLPKPSYSGFFFLTVLMNLLLVYLLYTLILILVKSLGRAPRHLTILLILAAVVLYPGLGVSQYSSLFFIFLAFYIYNEASKLRPIREVKVSDLRVGDNLAERIIEKDGNLVREKEGQASISSLLVELFRGDIEALVKPSPSGVTEEEKNRLMVLVESGRMENKIEVYSGVVISPLILTSLLVSVFVGDLFFILI